MAATQLQAGESRVRINDPSHQYHGRTAMLVRDGERVAIVQLAQALQAIVPRQHLTIVPVMRVVACR